MGVEPFFMLELQPLQTLYPGDHARGNTSTTDSPGTEYEWGIKVGEHLDNTLLGWLPDIREEDDPPTGRAHQHREMDDMQLGLHPSPEGINPRGESSDGGDLRKPKSREDQEFTRKPKHPFL